nr:hypothetical protein [Tanacetum cinerariifolium]
MDHIDRGKRRNKITGDFLRLPLKIYPIEGCQFGKVPMTKGKFCKVEVLCIVEDIDECHILLGRAWRCEVNGKYDVKRNLYLFSCERRRIAMVQPKVTPKLPNPKVKVEDKIVKAAIVEDHIEKTQDLQSYKKHDDNISTLSFGTTNKVDKDRREKEFYVDEALDIENSRASSFQVREIHVDKTNVNTVQDWSSPKTFPEVKQKKGDIFISQDKYVAKILRKFRLTEGKSASTPIDTEKPLLKDPDGEDVDVHTYRKSTIRGCQFLRCRLISWQCKKQTVVATSSTEAEYVATASCCAQ